MVAPGISKLDPLNTAVSELGFLQVKAPLVPLHLATIAALVPDDDQVDIWDEQVDGRIEESTEFGKDYDLVGITGYSSHLRRAKEVARIFRSRGVLIAMGGVGVSTTPEHYRDVADVLFFGEAELTWPQFITEWKAGRYRSQYRQVVKPALEISPVPRWDIIADRMHNYLLGAVQTTRGCPFNCEFCDVVSLFGNMPRNKPITRILEEVNTLANLGMGHIFFSDDNFIGNPGYTKELLRELIPLNNSFKRPVMFSTQVTINIAKDEELMEMMADANFNGLFIGIETPNKESLREAGKMLNVHSDLVEDCKKIQSYGMTIRAGMIVGFDHDDSGIFDQQFNFIEEANISLPSVSILTAIPGTRLWDRLNKEGRLVKMDTEKYVTGYLTTTNIAPKGMTFAELFTGYSGLITRLGNLSSFEARIKRMMSGIKRKPNVPGTKRQWKQIFQVLRFLLSQDKATRRSIIRIILYTRRHAPFMMYKVVGLIIQYCGLANLVALLYKDAQVQIDLAKSGVFDPEVGYTQSVIPEGFRNVYPEIFPEIHQQVCNDLKDKRHTAETLLAVFVDFINSQKDESDSFTDNHKKMLYEITESRVTKENDLTSALLISDHAAPDIEETRLAEEVLKAIEQELRIGRTYHSGVKG